MNVTAEFLIEPFSEGAPGPHVAAALGLLETAGCTVEVGPFGSSLAGDVAQVLPALSEAFSQALTAGATRLTLTIEADPT